MSAFTMVLSTISDDAMQGAGQATSVAVPPSGRFVSRESSPMNLPPPLTRMSPPLTSNLLTGVMVPIPTLPLPLTCSRRAGACRPPVAGERST